MLRVQRAQDGLGKLCSQSPLPATNRAVGARETPVAIVGERGLLHAGTDNEQDCRENKSSQCALKNVKLRLIVLVNRVAGLPIDEAPVKQQT